MAKRWRKQKAGRQEKKRRKVMAGGGDASSASGTIGGLRRFTKRLAGGGPAKPKTTASRILDIALWVAVAVAAYFVIARQCTR